ncbi:uncharacterized protein TNCV_4404111 [Trichonephila clavipes]|uniref:Uncharacterized protein n=1 Tax=Trichonephila clavipes TaxID=2585209 RepID=A0A8X6S2N8_TRICX|nr:uncharacterized protein TNCV_4404111 [Trichonephila clavipes]
MQDPPDSHMGNLDMTSDSLHTGTGIVSHQNQGSLLIVWRSYFSFHYESAVRQSLVQSCEVVVVGSQPPGATLGMQPLCGASIAMRSLVCQMHISELSVRVTFELGSKTVRAFCAPIDSVIESECESMSRVTSFEIEDSVVGVVSNAVGFEASSLSSSSTINLRHLGYPTTFGSVILQKRING